jgi:hypothetical protein
MSNSAGCLIRLVLLLLALLALLGLVVLMRVASTGWNF